MAHGTRKAGGSVERRTSNVERPTSNVEGLMAMDKGEWRIERGNKKERGEVARQMLHA